MAHSDDATKTWISAIPKKNSDGNVIEWRCKYKYTLAVGTGKGNIVTGVDGSNNKTYNNDYIHTFEKTVKYSLKNNTLIPLKAPSSYTKAELLTLMDKPHWDDMFNKKYAYHIASQPTVTKDTSFDVSTLNDS